MNLIFIDAHDDLPKFKRVVQAHIKKCETCLVLFENEEKLIAKTMSGNLKQLKTQVDIAKAWVHHFVKMRNHFSIEWWKNASSPKNDLKLEGRALERAEAFTDVQKQAERLKMLVEEAFFQLPTKKFANIMRALAALAQNPTSVDLSQKLKYELEQF